MIVVSDSSPLITLARIGRLDLLNQLFGRIQIAEEVRQEVVVRGAGRPAADAVHGADWIEIHRPADAADLAALRAGHALGVGELATILLARSLRAELVIMDERAEETERAEGRMVAFRPARIDHYSVVVGTAGELCI